MGEIGARQGVVAALGRRIQQAARVAGLEGPAPDPLADQVGTPEDLDAADLGRFEIERLDLAGDIEHAVRLAAGAGADRPPLLGQPPLPGSPVGGVGAIDVAAAPGLPRDAEGLDDGGLVAGDGLTRGVGRDVALSR